MLTADLSGLLVLLVLAAFLVVSLYVRARVSDRALSAIRTKSRKLSKEILEYRKVVAREDPDNTQAHALLIEAAMMLVYPKSHSSSIHIPHFAYLERRLDKGFDLLQNVENLLHGANCAGSNESLFQMFGKRSVLYDKILAVSKITADACPDNEAAHELLIEASKRLVFPADNIVSAYKEHGFDDVIVNYDRGLIYVARARAIAEACRLESDN